MQTNRERSTLLRLASAVLIAAASATACSEDTNGGGTGGLGGSAGSAGAAGSAGTAGTAGSAGTAGTSGAGGGGAGGMTGGASATISALKTVPNPASKVAGSGTFTEADGKVTLQVSVTDCPVGMHGFHIHDGTECGTDGAAAGMHWDPLSAGAHGQVNDPAPHHAGDAGMIDCAADGTGTFSITTAEWSLMSGSNINPIGHAVILHGVDAAQRVACGLIEADGAGAKFTLAATTLSANPEPNLAGTATFSESAGETSLHVQLTGCAEGMHGFHIHAGTECGDDGMAAMGHWDPLGANAHGQVNDPAPHHAGDAGMVMCMKDGTGTFDIKTKEWTLMAGSNINPVSHAVIVHGIDATNRVGCGVIAAN